MYNPIKKKEIELQTKPNEIVFTNPDEEEEEDEELPPNVYKLVCLFSLEEIINILFFILFSVLLSKGEYYGHLKCDRLMIGWADATAIYELVKAITKVLLIVAMLIFRKDFPNWLNFFLYNYLLLNFIIQWVIWIGLMILDSRYKDNCKNLGNAVRAYIVIAGMLIPTYMIIALVELKFLKCSYQCWQKVCSKGCEKLKNFCVGLKRCVKNKRINKTYIENKDSHHRK